MQTQRVNRTDPEKILMVGLNLSGWTSIVGTPAFYGTPSDITTVSFHGYAMTGHRDQGHQTRRMMSGIWTQAVATGATGLIQVFGVSSAIQIARGTSAPTAGCICVVSGAAKTGLTSSLLTFFESGVAPDVAVDGMPHVIILSATTTGASTNVGLVRCLH